MFSRSCPAKFNVWLHLLGPRPDGFTELSSLVVQLNVADTLHLTLHDEPASASHQVSLHCNQADLNTPANLVHQAAQAWLAQATALPPMHWHFSLTKRLPLQAGLGGGSSNAAAALALCQQAALVKGYPALNQEALHQVAARLGSDVPLFLAPHPVVHMGGRGEQLTPCPTYRWPSDLWLLLIKHPTLACPTPWAYGLVRSAQAYRGLASPLPVTLEQQQAWQAHAVNDFQPHVLAALPELAELAKTLQRHTLAQHITLCGSGSTLAAWFTHTPNAQQRQAIAQRLHQTVAVPTGQRLWLHWCQPSAHVPVVDHTP
jgi:4-diphosphocytidyl-2-C-methyl-D-erythritol kinase